ncbi:MAG: DedA family protein [Halioglobus sp.]|nr:DedA family protein [Halioglobus sp.]
MSLEELVSNYGYIVVIVGTFLEGETVVILGGISAHRGYLELPWVIASAALGSFVGDQVYFYLGRAKGQEFLAKRPQWQAKSDKVLLLLEKHQTLLIIGSRYMYGLRTVTPFLVGTAKISPLRYFIFDAVGVLIWSVLVSSLAYAFGYALEALVPQIKYYEKMLLVFIAMGGLMVWLIRRRGKRNGHGN